jgi:hypothetical protein
MIAADQGRSTVRSPFLKPIILAFAMLAVVLSSAACGMFDGDNPVEPSRNVVIQRFECDATSVAVGAVTTCRWQVEPDSAEVSLIEAIGIGTSKTLATGLPVSGNLTVSPKAPVTDYTLRVSRLSQVKTATVSITVK